MNLLKFIHYRRIKIIFALILIFIILYILLRLFVFDSDPFRLFVSFISENYLLLIERVSNYLLKWSGSSVTIHNHNIFIDGLQVNGFHTLTMYKKALLFSLLLLWFTHASFGRKMIFSIILVIVSFLFNSINNAVGAFWGSYDTNTIYSYISIPYSIGFLLLSLILHIWYFKNKESILFSINKLLNIVKYSISSNNLEKKVTEFFISLYVYIFIIEFLGVYFDFNLLIEFIFKSSQKILSLFGYEAIVGPSLLIGANGSIHMAKACLGFRTMFLFAWIVYFTGNENKNKWYYIIFGMLFLFIVNIIRFVLLFIHIQKHGGYVLAMDVHDMYNYIIYTIVFVLWVIWFEFFSDIKVGRKNLIDVT